LFNRGDGVRTEADRTLPLVHAEVIDNRTVGNALDGIHMGECLKGNPLVKGNTSDQNGDDGIEVVSGPASCYFNQPTEPTTVSDNHVWRNGDLGVEAAPGTPGGGNWAKHNGNPLQCVPGTLCSTTGKPKK
jgi:hypothetical protein